MCPLSQHHNFLHPFIVEASFLLQNNFAIQKILYSVRYNFASFVKTLLVERENSRKKITVVYIYSSQTLYRVELRLRFIRPSFSDSTIYWNALFSLLN